MESTPQVLGRPLGLFQPRMADLKSYTLRTEYGDTDSFSIGKGVRQGCVLSSYLFNMYSEYFVRQANLEEVDIGTVPDLGLGTLGTCPGASTRKGLHKSRH